MKEKIFKQIDKMINEMKKLVNSCGKYYKLLPKFKEEELTDEDITILETKMEEITKLGKELDSIQNQK